ncbi:hypothetical protein [Azospirillum soli]|uniref:hypothetical protein n=1 Tax=Azospirillum soli TaxID=1304799 RepID=UPI001AE2E29B|nr:hypothetical protein [Azospirillum soli]MBP2313592.1 hypothetical protein [Azospirillum soli]
MSFIGRPQLTIATPSHRPSDRRERRPLQPVSGYPDIPFFDRTESKSSPVTTARPDTSSAPRLAQVVHMATTGVWVVRLNGRLAEINGRAHWENQRDLAADAKRAGIALSDLVVRTGADD